MKDVQQMLKDMQYEKAVGELKVLQSMYYNPMSPLEDEKERGVIKAIINELSDNFG